MIDDNKREVNVDNQDNPDDVVISAEQAQSLDDNKSESSPDNKDAVETKESEDNTEETKDEAVGDEPLKLEPKPVDGETSKERALRKEVERLKRERREKSQEKVFSNIDNHKNDDVDIKELLDQGFTREDISNSEKIIKVLAPKLGLVSKTQTYQETANTVLENFIDGHKEYKPENDKDDIRWNRFVDIIKNDYNLNNKTSKQLESIYYRVHRDVCEELGEVSDSVKKRNAQQNKISSVSNSGGTQSSKHTTKPQTASKSVDVNGVKFSGFDEDDLS